MAGRRKGILGKISVLLKLITFDFITNVYLKIAQILASFAP
jgi:hypothetical protein